MPSMWIRRSSRPVIAFVTALLLLICQTAFAGQACAHAPVPAGEATVSTPCHVTPDDSAPTPAASVCEAGTAVGDSAKVQIHALTDLPAVAIAYLPMMSRTTAPRAFALDRTACYAPPLSVLHCRFLN